MVLLHAALLAAAPSSKDFIATTTVTPELRASLARDYEIVVVAQPHQGDAWSRLARRVTGDAGRWKEIAGYNSAGPNLAPDQLVRVPFQLLRPEFQRQIIVSLFPRDRVTAAGWRHLVIGGGIEGESLWNIAAWFTGNGSNYAAIRKANPAQGLSTRKGDVIVVPTELLTSAFRGKREMEGQNAASTAAEIRESADDPAQHTAAHEDASEAAVVEAVPVGQPSLSYDRESAIPYAVYRLQKDEALYSSVVIRFTGRVYSNDVFDVVDHIVKFNGISDVTKLPVGYPVRIPMDLLLPEYLPSDDPTRMAAEASKLASSKLAKRTRAKNLGGVWVILDAGHGGRDVGTIHDDVAEASYVYDVTCRLKRALEKKSAARVWMTTESKSQEYDPVDDDEIEPESDHVVLTTPRYKLDDPVVGVNLRWYLANSIFRRAMKNSVPPGKVIFISVHADSLHPSLRGAMAYIPGERYVQGSYWKSADVYLARAEVREKPVVTHSEKESLFAEGVSRDLAESVISSFEEAGLKTHPFGPVRGYVVRDGREWVPAVIRYNLVPTRLLLETCNLGNRNDRALMKTKKYREEIAQAIYRGIVSFFEERRTVEQRVASRE